MDILEFFKRFIFDRFRSDGRDVVLLELILKDSRVETLLCELRDTHATVYAHSLIVYRNAVFAFHDRFTLDGLVNFGIACLLHDIGKLRVSSEIINKHGKLSDDEFEEIKLHPILGRTILINYKFGLDIIVPVYQHHEKTDGTGYPCKIGEAGLSEEAKMLAVSDIYSALTEYRPYRVGIEENVFDIMDNMVGISSFYYSLLKERFSNNECFIA